MSFRRTPNSGRPQIPEDMRVSTRVAASLASQVLLEDAPSVEDKAGTAPLRQLAATIIRSADIDGQTPIIVPGKRVVLHPELIVALVSEVADLAERNIRIEAFSPSAGGWAGVALLRRHRRDVGVLASVLPYGAEIVEVNRISRPAGMGRPLFIGLATTTHLIRWLPTASCYRLVILESCFRTPVRSSTGATIERYRLKAIHGGS